MFGWSCLLVNEEVILWQNGRNEDFIDELHICTGTVIEIYYMYGTRDVPYGWY
jgi:hypothetical protein